MREGGMTILALSISQVTDTERLGIQSTKPHHGPPPDDTHTWLYAALEHRYPDHTTVRADAWVTWECWLLIGTDGVKSNLRDEIKKARRRQLREGIDRVRHWRATTFILSNDASSGARVPA
jgi:hypothetical protein